MARSTPHSQGRGAKARPPGRADRQPAPDASDRRWIIVPLVLVGVLVVALAVVLPRVIDSGEDPAPANAADPGLAHVHGLGVDPKDGTLYAATHHGVFRIPDTGKAARIADRDQDTMGFTVVGPRHFLGSGHPDKRENKLGQLGLIESTDAGETWNALSLEGEADFHALEAAHGRVYGFDASSAQFMVSNDHRTWETRSLTPMYDFAVSPADPDTILATLEDGLARSTDNGQSFATVQGAPPIVVLAWPAKDLLYGVTGAGAVMLSGDGGTTWQQRGSVDGQPEALVATSKQTVHAATKSGIYTSTDGGRTFKLRYRD